jgi:hypothetical protein
MTLFMKKRRDLPTQPDLSNQEGFGLFVRRDPESGEETEILASTESAATTDAAPRRPSQDVTDVVVVEVVEPSEPRAIPGLRARKAKADVQDAAPAEAPFMPQAESSTQAVPGLRTSRKPKPEPQDAAVTDSQSAPQKQSDGPNIPGLRMPRKNRDEAPAAPVETQVAPIEAPEETVSPNIPGLRMPRKNKDEAPTPAPVQEELATQSVPGLRLKPKAEQKPVPAAEQPEEQFASRFVKQPAEPVAEVVAEPEAPAQQASTPQGGLGLRITRKTEAEPLQVPADESDSAVEAAPAVSAPAAKSGLADLAKRFKRATPAAETVKAEGSSLMSRFGRKKAETKEVAEDFVVTEEQAPVAAKADAKKSLSGLWSRGKPAAKDSAKPEKSSRTKAKPSKASRTGAGNQIDLLLELNAEHRVYWRVTPTGLVSVEAADVRQAASFSAEDGRYGTEATLTYSQAMNLALTELGEDCRIVNVSKTLQSVYATRLARVQNLELPVGPGLMLIEQLLRAGDHTGHNTVVGLLLEDESSAQSLAILYHVNSQGDFSTPQITVNPDNLSFTLSQFASSKRLDADATEVLLFKNAELLSVAGSLQVYPKEQVWNGVPVRKLLWGAAVLSCAAAFGAAGYGGQAYLAKRSLEKQQTTLTSQIQSVDTELKTIISDSLVSFAGTQTVDVQEVTARAAHLWVPYSKVTLEATATSQHFDIQMPLNGGGIFNNRPSVLGQLATRDVEPLIGMSAPEGCSKDILGVSGGLDAVQISITCESATRPVHRYRTD